MPKRKLSKSMESSACEELRRKVVKVIHHEFSAAVDQKMREIDEIDAEILKTKELLRMQRYFIATHNYSNKQPAAVDWGTEFSPPSKEIIKVEQNTESKPESPTIRSPKEPLERLSEGKSARLWSRSSLLENRSLLKKSNKIPLPSETPSCPSLDECNRNRVKKKLIIGNSYEYQKKSSNGDKLKFKWLLYVRGSQDEPDVSSYIESVEVLLDKSYAPHHMVMLQQSPFEMSWRGSKEFDVLLKISFKNSVNKPLEIAHPVTLNKSQDSLALSGICRTGVETWYNVWISNGNKCNHLQDPCLSSTTPHYLVTHETEKPHSTPNSIDSLPKNKKVVPPELVQVEIVQDFNPGNSEYIVCPWETRLPTTQRKPAVPNPLKQLHLTQVTRSCLMPSMNQNSIASIKHTQSASNVKTVPQLYTERANIRQPFIRNPHCRTAAPIVPIRLSVKANVVSLVNFNTARLKMKKGPGGSFSIPRSAVNFLPPRPSPGSIIPVQRFPTPVRIVRNPPIPANVRPKQIRNEFTGDQTLFKVFIKPNSATGIFKSKFTCAERIKLAYDSCRACSTADQIIRRLAKEFFTPNLLKELPLSHPNGKWQFGINQADRVWKARLIKRCLVQKKVPNCNEWTIPVIICWLQRHHMLPIFGPLPSRMDRIILPAPTVIRSYKEKPPPKCLTHPLTKQHKSLRDSQADFLLVDNNGCQFVKKKTRELGLELPIEHIDNHTTIDTSKIVVWKAALSMMEDLLRSSYAVAYEMESKTRNDKGEQYTIELDHVERVLQRNPRLQAFTFDL